MSKFITSIKKIGAEAFFESLPVLILFDESAPTELADVSIIHSNNPSEHQEVLAVGRKIYFGDQEYTIKKVGDSANKNFQELGHISLYFDLNEEDDLLPGAISLTPNQLPTLHEGDTITITLD